MRALTADRLARRTILSHFSQRYPKIPVIDSSFAASTCIAFDLMAVNLQGAQGPPASCSAALLSAMLLLAGLTCA